MKVKVMSIDEHGQGSARKRILRGDTDTHLCKVHIQGNAPRNKAHTQGEKRSFESLIKNRTDEQRKEIMKRLRAFVMHNQYKGVNIALIVLVMLDEKMLTDTPTFPEVQEAFAGIDIGKRQGFTRPYAKGLSNYKTEKVKAFKTELTEIYTPFA